MQMKIMKKKGKYEKSKMKTKDYLHETLAGNLNHDARFAIL